jgi:hypothetical protein
LIGASSHRIIGFGRLRCCTVGRKARLCHVWSSIWNKSLGFHQFYSSLQGTLFGLFVVQSVGDCRDEFTIEIHHGGFFVGSGHLKSYINDRVSWFDRVEPETFSPLWFLDFAQQLGYRSNEHLKIHWLLPGKTLANGLRLIVSDTDTNVMATCAEDVKNLVVYFVHEDMFSEVDWDDVVANPVTELPKVISPRKVQYVEKNPKEKLPVFYTNLDNTRVDQVVGSEDDVLWDSNNEIEEGDADLFDDLVSSHVQVKGHKKARGSKLKDTGDI